ncbi:MAG: hypothetical protein IKB73_05480 [Ruminococcus sp.]|nr:hypothetical protein [Ruminococcus sp.]
MIKKIVICIVVLLAIMVLSNTSFSAEEISDLEKSVDNLRNSLSQEVLDDMNDIGADTFELSKLSDVSFESIVNLIMKKFSENSFAPFSSSCIVIAVLILNSVIESYCDSLKHSSSKEVLSLISTLLITTTLVMPIIDLIGNTISTITDASNFMLIYIPIMISILMFSGHAVSGASYYSMMLLACQGLAQISTKFISPLLSVYLGFSVSSAISDKVNLKGFCQMFSKVIKWLIAFSMTVFTALLTIRGMITTAYDSVTARAVRFTMSSFIPIVGAALAESYKTIQGSINLLRTGAGVFVILAIFVVFLPTIIRCVIWSFSLNMCKSIGEVMGVESPVTILASVSSVVSTILAITISIVAVFVISTALLITLGGGAQ